MQVFGLDYTFTYFWLGAFGVSGIVSLSCPASTKGLMYFFLFFCLICQPHSCKYFACGSWNSTKINNIIGFSCQLIFRCFSSVTLLRYSVTAVRYFSFRFVTFLGYSVTLLRYSDTSLVTFAPESNYDFFLFSSLSTSILSSSSCTRIKPLPTPVYGNKPSSCKHPEGLPFVFLSNKPLPTNE